MIGLAFFTLSFIAFLLYFLVIPTINYFRDPKGLRKFPQLSIWSGISDIPYLRASQRGFRSHTVLEAHKNHPVLRIGPNSLSYRDVRAIKDIYGHGTTCIKDQFYVEVGGPHAHLADVIDKSEHARKRKVLSNAYAVKNLEEWEYKVSDMTDRLIKAFDGFCTSPLKEGALPDNSDLTVEYCMWSNLFTIAAIANIGLSEDIRFLENGDDLITSEKMDGVTKKYTSESWSYDWFKTLARIRKVVSSSYRKMWRLSDDWSGVVYNRATTRMKRYEDGEKLDDFFSVLMNDKNGNPYNLEWGEIVSEISIMMNAGSDTTAIAANATLYLLLKNPNCLQKLRDGVASVLDPDETVAAYDKVRHLPYLRACIDETLRLYPPVSMNLPRRTPPEGATILDDFIAGDTSVSISAYVVHRNPAVFPEPETYRPEHWLGEAGKELQPYFVAFSAGARGCIGRNISYLKQTVLLASLVNRFEFALPSPDWKPTIRETTNLNSGPMPLKIWRRDASVACA
ncbi:cytochrome protein [Penicillium malachiteum]|uniref:Cytochrome protein n=1 Tax=Penicillium malachiteum TaxID=1324776 RepID=A0AAD6HDN0_9EURO|nr:cytochrome protein [Penicillium malachiteum]